MPKPPSLPGEDTPPWQSKLTPFIDDIWRWRRAGKTFDQIANLLLSEKSIKTNKSSVKRFIDARKRRFKELDLPVVPGTEALATPLPVSPRPVKPAESPSRPARKVASNPAQTSGETTGRGLPLPASQEVIGTDEMGRKITRNKPFKGNI